LVLQHAEIRPYPRTSESATSGFVGLGDSRLGGKPLACSGDG
jgi:hypothetical protein